MSSKLDLGLVRLTQERLIQYIREHDRDLDIHSLVYLLPGSECIQYRTSIDSYN
jgi:hypothetical protein